MLTRWLDLNDTLSMVNAFERQMNHYLEPAARPSPSDTTALTFDDQGDKLVITATLAGLSPADVELTLEGDMLTIKAERTVRPPDGYKVVRAERGSLQLHRQLELPCRVRADGVEAELHDGVLTVTLPKAPEAQPRKIAIGRRESNRN